MEDEAAKSYFANLAESGDVLLRFSLDEVVSKGSHEASRRLFGKTQSLEIFQEPESVKAVNRGTTRSTEFILAPHRLVQIRNSSRGEEVEPLFHMIDTVIAYTQKGDVHAI